jgi:hypothetical protein
METKKTIYQLHEEHKTWLNKLLFYKDELKIMEKRILEVAERNTSKEVRALADHFTNQLIIQKEQIDILTHDIKSHELHLEAAVQKNPIVLIMKNFQTIKSTEKASPYLKNYLKNQKKS